MASVLNYVPASLGEKAGWALEELSTQWTLHPLQWASTQHQHVHHPSSQIDSFFPTVPQRPQPPSSRLEIWNNRAGLRLNSGASSRGRNLPYKRRGFGQFSRYLDPQVQHVKLTFRPKINFPACATYLYVAVVATKNNAKSSTLFTVNGSQVRDQYLSGKTIQLSLG